MAIRVGVLPECRSAALRVSAGQATIPLVPSASRLGERAAQALPAAVVLALAAFMVERDGGFAQTVWSPIALLLIAFAVTLAFSRAPARRRCPSRDDRCRVLPRRARGVRVRHDRLGGGARRCVERLEPGSALPRRLLAARALAGHDRQRLGAAAGLLGDRRGRGSVDGRADRPHVGSLAVRDRDAAVGAARLPERDRRPST